MAPLCPKPGSITTSRRRCSAGPQNQRISLAARTAECGDGVSGTAPCQLEGRVQGDAGARHPNRVSDGDRAAVDVHLRGVDAQLFRRRQRDRGERLIDLDDVELIDGDALARDGFLDGVGRLTLQGRVRACDNAVGADLREPCQPGMLLLQL